MGESTGSAGGAPAGVSYNRLARERDGRLGGNIGVLPKPYLFTSPQWGEVKSSAFLAPPDHRRPLMPALKQTGSRYPRDTVTSFGLSSLSAWNSGSVARHSDRAPFRGAS